ncbi:lipopolysaccharide biosynthesis protein [Geodermatophilus sabuli]|uniref:Polysaccharide transporter, PST family n=1 Tax=Geodermatophilus sabuli TaxID=1564158 RepID=A0A285EJJ8_9ACTN|nr:lipopolysaccharide biosynthesis protein [Geodermatophilus sabuli]MBB3083221.1 PST family polysaccharide transporter [Geodermatophilus sabuli]SNX98216.1 polysaccharide transporter, PST family [Geodermatophilus sabuli]
MTRSAVRGLSWSLLGALGQSLLQVVSIVVLSRLLSAEQFGTAMAATVVMSLAVMLGQLGIGPALVQSRELSRADVATAFTVAAGLGVALATVLFLAAPVVNPLVGLPADSSFLRLLSIVLVLGGLSSVSLALLQRRLRFRDLVLVELLSYGVGHLGTSVVLALAGAGAAALVWGQVAQAALTAIGGYALVRHAVRPCRPAVMARSGRRILSFGSAYSLSQLGNWVGLNGDNLVVTSTLGPASLGVYSRAYQLLVQPANLIGTVADKVLFPSLARIQDDRERLARAYVLACSLVALLTLPVSVLLSVLAPEVVAILLGPGWSAVVLPLQVFAVVLLPRTAYKISGSLTRATGAVLGGAWRQWLYAAEVAVGCAIGSTWGISGVAVGASVAIVLHFATMLTFSARISRGLAGRVLRSFAKSLPIAAATAAAAWPVATALRHSAPDLVVALGTAAAGVLAAAAALVACRRLFRDELAVWAVARSRPAPPVRTAP